MSTVFQAVLLQVLQLRVNTISDDDSIHSGFCSTGYTNLGISFDIRCSRHNYTDFRDTHWFDLDGYEREEHHFCQVTECIGPHMCMDDKCPGNMTRECLRECCVIPKTDQNYPAPPCEYMPGEIESYYKIPTIYTLRISDELFLLNQILVREWRKDMWPEKHEKFFTTVNSSYNYILSGRGNTSHCVEIEKSMDWCNDRSKGRMYNGTYVLCREEQDLWRVMSEFGGRATHCIRYYIQRNFLKSKSSGDFKKDMTETCASFENELQKKPELATTHTTDRHSVEINTYNACCFLTKSNLIPKFNCTGETTTPYPNTPAPTVPHELRRESELNVYDSSFLSDSTTSTTISLCSLLFVLFCRH